VSRIAVYPGTFDPVTHGHLDLVDRGRRHFDELVVAVLRNEDKRPIFSVSERIELLRDAVAAWDNVRVEGFDGLLVDYARTIGASVILRGIRAASDFEYELQMAMMNRRLEPGVETIFLVPNESYAYLSSRLVREIAQLGGEVGGLVPARVAEALHARLGSRQPRRRR
jgi:pantetheine-phosphate adenylyltransferase